MAVDRVARLALLLAWMVLVGTLLLEGATWLRNYLGYEAFDSQWGLIGMVSVIGIVVILFLALFQFVVVTIGLVLAGQSGNQVEGRRLKLALAINLVGFLLFIFL